MDGWSVCFYYGSCSVAQLQSSAPPPPLRQGTVNIAAPWALERVRGRRLLDRFSTSKGTCETARDHCTTQCYSAFISCGCCCRDQILCRVDELLLWLMRLKPFRDSDWFIVTELWRMFMMISTLLGACMYLILPLPCVSVPAVPSPLSLCLPLFRPNLLFHSLAIAIRCLCF